MADNVRKVLFCVSSDYARLTGGSVYNRRLVSELASAGRAVDWLAVGEGFPFPSVRTRQLAGAALEQVAPGTILMVDGLVLGVLPDVFETVRRKNPIVGLIHHPLSYEDEASAVASSDFRRRENAAFRTADHLVATSATTARILRTEFSISVSDITVAPPGLDRRSFASGGAGDALSILSVGAFIRRKGYSNLIAAMAGLGALPWHLTILGDMSRSPETVKGLREQIVHFGLDSKVQLIGGPSDSVVERLYRGSDLYISSSRFEGYGMAIADALGFGLPVVAVAGGAVAEVVPPTAGILVPPDDTDSLANAIRTLISDADLRARYRDGARAISSTLPEWAYTRVQVEKVLDGLLR